MAMKRMSFHLSTEQVERLYAAAAQRDISASELLRRLIDQGLARLGVPSELGEGVIMEHMQQQIDTLRKELQSVRQSRNDTNSLR